MKTEKAVVETTISPARSESAPISLAMVKEATAVGAAVTQRYETICSEEKFKYLAIKIIIPGNNISLKKFTDIM